MLFQEEIEMFGDSYVGANPHNVAVVRALFRLRLEHFSCRCTLGHGPKHHFSPIRMALRRIFRFTATGEMLWQHKPAALFLFPKSLRSLDVPAEGHLWRDQPDLRARCLYQRHYVVLQKPLCALLRICRAGGRSLKCLFRRSSCEMPTCWG